MKFLIYNLTFGAYWKPDSADLTTDINEAGVYDEAEAIKLCFESNCYVNRELPPSAALIPIKTTTTPESRHIPTKTLLPG
jgi:hypothetical protein